MIRLLSLSFILLWSSAFITGKVIVKFASPFASLSLRFALVAFGFFLFTIIFKEKINVKRKNIIESCISGILFHGLYLGGCFYSFSKTRGFAPPTREIAMAHLEPLITILFVKVELI